MPRYRFQDFVLSPRQRTLLRGDREVPLIPRYFDLLVFLVERRHQAVHRRDIFDHVWRDVVVSDSALSQAIRTIRRILDDDSREPRFVRTVSRHGYRFVFDEVIEEYEEDDVAALQPGANASAEVALQAGLNATAPVEPRIVLPGAEYTRWMGAVLGGTGAGIGAGGIGALLLASVPDSHASLAVVPVLTLLGGLCGAAGAAGVSTGLSLAERGELRLLTNTSNTSTVVRVAALRTLILVIGAAAGGGAAGLLAQLFGHWTLETVTGVTVPVGGFVQGLALGAACGLAYALVSPRMEERPERSAGGWANVEAQPLHSPRTPAAIVGAFAWLCGLTALGLVIAGLPLVGGTLHAISQASAGAQTTLAPLGHLLGEQDFGPLTAALIGTGEGVIFGAGFGLGLVRRPASGHPAPGSR